MELLGTHKVTFDEIRSLAIQCHALDISAYHLFVDSTHKDNSGITKSTYHDLFTRQLLGLAIALRTKFYQGIKHEDTASYVTASGRMNKPKDGVEEFVNFSMKDVCDKIIHADSVSRSMEKDDKKPITIIRGEHFDKLDWELTLSVSLFTEGVLNWTREFEEKPADDLEARAAESIPAGEQSSGVAVYAVPEPKSKFQKNFVARLRKC